MKRSLMEWSRPESRKGSLAVAIAVHAVAIVALAGITFHYQIGVFLGQEKPRSETVSYVRPAAPSPSRPAGSESRDQVLPKMGNPARVFAPTVIPRGIPALPAPGASVGSLTAKPGGNGGTRAGLVTGIEPRTPDERVELNPNRWGIPRSPAQRTDSAVRAALASWHDSVVMAAANIPRDPRDWTWEKNGQKYGWDPQGIHLGKFVIPNALLAALPFNTGGVDGQRVLDNRQADYIRQDILLHQNVMSEEDLRTTIKRIRERVDKEKAEKEKEKTVATSKGPDSPQP